MHIVGTDLCRRLNIEGEIVTDETAILNKAYFLFLADDLAFLFFAFEPNTLGGSFACCILYIWRFWRIDEYERYKTQLYKHA